MHKFFLAIAIAFCAIACNNKIMYSKSRIKVPSGYKLVWSDEFNNIGQPDSTNWNYEYGFVRNDEQQFYQPENAYCKNGLLMIEART